VDSNEPHSEESVGLILRNEAGRAIRSVDEWLKLAPPKKGLAHWKDGRSAKELAKAWLREPTPSPPSELSRLFASHPATQGMVIREAVAERRLRLDDFDGETRNTDLWLRCGIEDEVVVATIEGKADESFGAKIGAYYDSKRGTSSNVPARIDALCNAVFGHELTTEIRSLRYQLLHGAAATLISAGDHGATKAVFIVHEFHSAGCKQSAVMRNSADWGQFLRSLRTVPYLTETEEYPAQTETAPFKMFGPVGVPGGEFVPFGISLFLGFVRTKLTEPGFQDFENEFLGQRSQPPC
jgi:hypothetical protein